MARALTALGAVVLLVAMFLDWYRLDVTGTTLGGATSVNAWQAFAWIDFALVVAVVAAVTTATVGSRVPVLGEPVFAAGAGLLALLLVVVRWIEPPVEAGSTGFATVEIVRRPGLAVALSGAALILAGGAWLWVKRP